MYIWNLVQFPFNKNVMDGTGSFSIKTFMFRNFGVLKSSVFYTHSLFYYLKILFSNSGVVKSGVFETLLFNCFKNSFLKFWCAGLISI